MTFLISRAKFGSVVIILTLVVVSLNVKRWLFLVDVNRAVSSSVLEDYSEGEPLDGGGFSFGEFELVGHGEVTNDRCGRFSGYFYGCDRVDLHNKTTLDGVDHTGKVHIEKPIFHSCNKPSCPKCYKYGWAVREAKAIEARLKKASKRFGQVEHLSISIPVKDYGLDIESLRLKVTERLKALGVVGGALIFHGFRYANYEEAKRKNVVAGWRWSIHFHGLVFIFGGYSRCRKCARKWNCDAGCDGFDSKAWKAYQKDGYYVKVFGKRKSVFLTAFYQLHHSTIKKDVKRFHVATWFGNCSYRELKVTVEMRKLFCPICLHDLVKLRYNGVKLDTWLLVYGGSCSVDLEEDSWLAGEKEVVWQRFIPSGSHKSRGGQHG